MRKIINHNRLSKIISHALRHEPELYRIKLDSQGWVPLKELCNAIKYNDPEFTELVEDDIYEMIALAKKQRHEICEDYIRACYGHSTNISINHIHHIPPFDLYHGTSIDSIPHILIEGLKPMGRLFVHLSSEKEAALIIGKRKSNNTSLLQINALNASNEGIGFFHANKNIWLSEFIPTKFLCVIN